MVFDKNVSIDIHPFWCIFINVYNYYISNDAKMAFQLPVFIRKSSGFFGGSFELTACRCNARVSGELWTTLQYRYCIQYVYGTSEQERSKQYRGRTDKSAHGLNFPSAIEDPFSRFSSVNFVFFSTKTVMDLTQPIIRPGAFYCRGFRTNIGCY